MKMNKWIAFILGLIVFNSVYAGKIAVTDGWKYKAADNERFAEINWDDKDWKTVNIPHTWNDEDLIDEQRGYRRAASWYRKELFIPKEFSGKKVVLIFEGIGSKADVYLNGVHLKTHLGAYTAFTVDITEACRFGDKNLVAVRADNSSSLAEIVPPVSGDFSMQGGIYRRVFLQTYGKVYFDRGAYASTPVLVQTPEVTEEQAKVSLSTQLKNESDKNQKVTVRFTLYDKERNIVKREEKKITIKTGQVYPLSVPMNNIQKPHLWSPDSPYLYTLRSEILDHATNEQLQEIETSLGFRWFSVDKTGFYLNGNYLKLRGAARHQDYWGLGIAIPSEVNYNDMKLLKEMGANFVRISHYPQDSEIYRACDELGLIAWSEICIVNEVKKNEEFAFNSREMLKEMIYQNYNHPSVMIWGAMNELWNYHDEALRLAEELEAIKKEIDPYRLSCVAFHAFTWEKPFTQDNKRMFEISDINGVNVYESWYHGDFNTIAPMFDKFRDYSVHKPRFLSEYGAGSDERIHSYTPLTFDFTPEFQLEFNRRYVDEMEARPDYVGYSIWNLIDFQVDGRGDSKPNLNQKGMLYANREKKEIYYYYQARWSKEPMLHIGGADWLQREEVCDHPVNNRKHLVFSNQKQVELIHNGKSLGTSSVHDGLAEFVVPFVNGKNKLEARSGSLSDYLEINMVLLPSKLADHPNLAKGLYLNLGQDHCYFTDPLTQRTWLPDQPYTEGSWGYVDGKPFKSWSGSSHDGVRCGVGANIKDTELEPLFQTFLLGTTSYRLDVPDGVYELTLCFTEPFNAHERKDMKRTGTSESGQRIFDISVNGKVFLHELDLEKQHKQQTAVTKTIVIHVNDHEGIKIGFHPHKGHSVVSGLKVIKLH